MKTKQCTRCKRTKVASTFNKKSEICRACSMWAKRQAPGNTYSPFSYLCLACKKPISSFRNKCRGKVCFGCELEHYKAA